MVATMSVVLRIKRDPAKFVFVWVSRCAHDENIALPILVPIGSASLVASDFLTCAGVVVVVVGNRNSFSSFHL